MRVLHVEQLPPAGLETGEPTVDGDVLTIPVTGPSGTIIERYQLTGLSEEPTPGADLADGPILYGLLVAAWLEDGEPVAQVIRWKPHVLEEPERTEEADGE